MGRRKCPLNVPGVKIVRTREKVFEAGATDARFVGVICLDLLADQDRSKKGIQPSNQRSSTSLIA